MPVGHGLNKGSNNGAAKLKEDDVCKIRELRRKGILRRDVAKMFRVTESAIRDITAGITWGWLEDPHFDS